LAVDKLGNPRGADPGLRRLIGIGGVVDEDCIRPSMGIFKFLTN
jgi:hypothetical protein